MTTELHQYDVSSSIVYRVQENSASLDVSNASGIWFFYEKPDESTTGSWAAIARSGSADEFIYVTTASTDLDTAGTWKLHAYFHLDPWEGSSDIKPFQVYESLRG